MIKGFSSGDEIFYIETIEDGVKDVRYLKFVNSKKCLSARFINYSPFKYFFDIDKNELIDIEYFTKKDFCEKFDSYEIEPIKFRKMGEPYWQDYSRSKRDYNWKYEILSGVNEEWVMMKKKFLDETLEEIKQIKFNCKGFTEGHQALKALEKSCDDMLEELSKPVGLHGMFTRARGSGFSNIEFVRTTAFFDTMLKEYNKLFLKYGNKTEHIVFTILQDFKVLIDKNSNLTRTEKLIVKSIMNNGFNYDEISNIIHNNSSNKINLYGKNDIKQMVDYIIPNKIFKQYDLICKMKEVE